MREAVRTRQYSIRTEEAFFRWIRQYILFFNKRHPSEIGASEVSAFLSYLAVKRRVAASTQNQALSALLFLYREVLDQQIEWVDDVESARRSPRDCRSFSPKRRCRLCWHNCLRIRLMASLLYVSGLRLTECVRLRVKDIDFAQLQLVVREGKGDKERVMMLPSIIVEPLRRQLERAEALHKMDLREGCGRVYLPHALARKYANADREWG